MSIPSFLQHVAQQKHGYRFADPERIGENSLAVVVPILRKTSVKRQYVLLPESAETKVIDTGNISRFQIQNPTKENVFIRAGTIFKGPTQERALVRSAVVFPGQTAEVEVRCVHASRGISRGSQTSYGGTTPLQFDQAVYGKGFTGSGQNAYWQSAESYSLFCSGLGDVASSAPRMPSNVLRTSSVRPFGARQPITTECSVPEPCERTSGGIGTKTDDLHTTIQNMASNLDDILKKVKCQKDQVGLAFLSDKGCQTVELFDVAASWAALHEDAVKRIGPDLARKDTEGVFDYKKEMACSTVAAVLADDYKINLIHEHRPSNGEPAVKISGLTSDRFIGEVVELDKRVIHLVLNRTLQN